MADSMSNKMEDAVTIEGSIPGEGAGRDTVLNLEVYCVNKDGASTVILLDLIGEGGEGRIYRTNRPGEVAKIYHRDSLTENKISKLKTMIDARISYPGICFPDSLLLNESQEFIGYLMPRAEGYELARSVLSPEMLFEKFPRWNRADLFTLAMNILDKIAFLNSRKIFLGDFNPSNILIVSPDQIFLVDCDSYQIDDFPCPVGTAMFLAPEILNEDFDKILRTQSTENFSVAVLVFVILMLGQSPYSARTESTTPENQQRGIFPYSVTPSPQEENLVPMGPWLGMWELLPLVIRQDLYDVLSRNGSNYLPDLRISIAQWLRDLRQAQSQLLSECEHDKRVLNVLGLNEIPERFQQIRTESLRRLPLHDLTASNQRPIAYQHRETVDDPSFNDPSPQITSAEPKASEAIRRRPLFIVITSIVALLAIALILYVSLTASKDDGTEAIDANYAAPQDSASTVEEYPESGTILINTLEAAEKSAAVTIDQQSTNACVLKLVNSSSGNEIEMFVDAESSGTITVPLGEYDIYVCGGTTWYGAERLFGPEGFYACSGINFPMMMEKGIHIYMNIPAYNDPREAVTEGLQAISYQDFLESGKGD